MFIFVRFAFVSALYSATKQFTVNCQSTRIDDPGSRDVEENSLRIIMNKLASLETMQHSIQDTISSSLNSILIEQGQRSKQIVQTLKDLHRDLVENLTSGSEVLYTRMNKSNQHFLEEQSQIVLLRFSRHLDEQFQGQYNGSQKQFRRLRDELDDRCRNQTPNIESLHRQTLHNQSQQINEGIRKMMESQSQLQTLGNNLSRLITEIKSENQQTIDRLSMDFNRSIWTLKFDVRHLVAISGHQQFKSARLNRTIARGKRIRGLAIYQNKLFLGRSYEKELEIYDTTTFNLERRLSMPRLHCISDLTTCPKCDVVYVVDTCNRSIYAIDMNGTRFYWGVTDSPLSISVNSQSNVIVTFKETGKLREFTSSGQLIREINLQSKIKCLQHAVQLDEDRYAVVHGDNKDAGLHQVCIVNRNGQITRCFGGRRGSEEGRLHTPTRILTFGRSLIVSDLNNNRLLVLSSTFLTLLKTVNSIQAVRMSLSEDGSRLYWAQNIPNNSSYAGGEVKVTDVTWD